MAEVSTFTANSGNEKVHHGEYAYMHKETDPFIDYEGDLRWQQACGFAWMVRATWHISWTASR